MDIKFADSMMTSFFLLKANLLLLLWQKNGFSRNFEPQ